MNSLGNASFAKLGIALVLTAGVALGGARVASAQATATDLGSLPPNPSFGTINFTTALALNNSAQVVGRGRVVDGGTTFAHAFLSSSGGAVVDINPVVATPSGVPSRFSFAFGISDTNILCGRADINDALVARRDAGYTLDPVVAGGQGTLRLINEPGSDNFSAANAIEPFGITTGISGVLDPAGAALTRIQAMVDYSYYNGFPGQFEALLLPFLPDGDVSTATSISDRFRSVGEDDRTDDNTVAGLLVEARAFFSDFGDVSQEIVPADNDFNGTIDDPDASASSISQQSFYVTGLSGTINDFDVPPVPAISSCLWFRGNFGPPYGTYYPFKFGDLVASRDGLANSVKEDANFNPIVVGIADVSATESHAYVYSFTGFGAGAIPAGTVDLNAITSLPAGVFLEEATEVRVSPNGQVYISVNASIPDPSTGGRTTRAYLVTLPAANARVANSIPAPMVAPSVLTSPAISAATNSLHARRGVYAREMDRLASTN